MESQGFDDTRKQTYNIRRKELACKAQSLSPISTMTRTSGIEQANKRARYLASLNQSGRPGRGALPSTIGDQKRKPAALTSRVSQPLCPYFEDKGYVSDGDREWSEEEKNSPSKSKGE